MAISGDGSERYLLNSQVKTARAPRIAVYSNEVYGQMFLTMWEDNETFRRFVLGSEYYAFIGQVICKTVEKLI